MVLFGTLRRSGGIEAVARHLAIPPAFTQTIIPIAMDSVVAQYRSRYLAGGAGSAGIDHVLTLVAGFGGGQMAREVLLPDPVDIAKGEALLAALYGTAEASGAAIQTSARHSGIDEALLAKAFPLLAMLVGGYLAARADGWANEDLPSDQSKAHVAEFERLISPAIPAKPRPRKFDDDAR